MAVAHGSRGIGRAVRVRLALQVALGIVLAGGAAFLATWLAARPGLAARLDCTASARNTLPAELVEIVEALPRPARIETFLRPLEAPFTELSQDVIARLEDFLYVLGHGRDSKLAVVHWNLDDLTTAKARLAELDLREDNVLVVSCGAERTVLRLYRDVAPVDVGDPTRGAAAPRLASFRPEQALALALKRVSSGEPVRILFSAGHGERKSSAPGEGSVHELVRALERDGFALGAWDGARELDPPADCRVVAIVQPTQAFAAAELDALRRFLARGGRLFVVPGAQTGGGLEDLLADCGIRAARGRVAAPFLDPSGTLRGGDARCASIVVAYEGLDPRHPVTESLWRARRRLLLPASRAFARSDRAPADAAFSELVRAPREAWIDLPGAGGEHDWMPDMVAETPGPEPLCVAVEYLAPAAPREASSPGERATTRVLALGSGEALTDRLIAQNGDLALNAFNWLAARDWRLSIPPRSDERVRIDLGASPALAWFRRLAIGALPLVSACLGLVVFLRRRGA